ncbi:MAG: Gfo/Idh/MocA family protein [Steroidobacteraceae bacterium]
MRTPVRIRSSAPTSRSASGPIRYAVIGLGYISQVAVLPAFANARQNSALAALVSDDPRKLQKLGRHYDVDLLCKYDDVDKLFSSGAIDAVYIALPNAMHAEYAIRAAKAGLHVLSEKPMAVTSHDCERMIEAAQQGGVKLMIAYRLHFEPGNLDALHIARSGQLGDLRFFTSQFSMQVAAENIRVKREMGGGPLYDIGIYCINAARTVFAVEPVEVLATAVTHNDPRFKEVPETVVAVMKFPQKAIASFTCSFGSAARSVYEIVGTKGSITLDPGYEMSEGIAYELRVGNRTRSRHYKKSDQFAPELIHFSDCILHDREPEPSGEEGLADIRIIEAFNRSILSGKWVALDVPPRKRRPDKRLSLSKPAMESPALVRAAAPHPPA